MLTANCYPVLYVYPDLLLTGALSTSLQHDRREEERLHTERPILRPAHLHRQRPAQQTQGRVVLRVPQAAHDPRDRLLLHPTQAVRVPTVPEHPSVADQRAQRRLSAVGDDIGRVSAGSGAHPPPAGSAGRHVHAVPVEECRR